MNFKPLAATFIALTIIFAATTVYFATSTSGGTRTETSTLLSTLTQTLTSTQSAPSTTAASTAAGSGYSVGIAYSPSVGFYLVDGAGFTLYFRTTDFQSNGTSTCTGACVQTWPVFYQADLVLPPGLNASSFHTVTRADGTMQLTYDGWPLYSYAGDAKPGETNGEGIAGIWFAVSLPTPHAGTSSAGSTTTTASTAASTSSTTATSSTYSYTYSTTTSRTTTSTSTTSSYKY